MTAMTRSPDTPMKPAASNGGGTPGAGLRAHASDLRGLVMLATQAVAGVTGVIEAVHQSVWSTLGFPGGDQPGRVLGRGADALLAALEPGAAHVDKARRARASHEALQAVLNGVFGDHLAATGNPLAIRMGLRRSGLELADDDAPAASLATGRILVMVHGLCMSDLHWRVRGDDGLVDHGEALAAAHGYTCLHLRYNSGLSVARNGAELSMRLERLLAAWPVEPEALAIVGHSMGGLLARSAVHHGMGASLRWPRHLRHMAFLGTPHHGAPLERAGNWVEGLLAATRYTAPFAAVGRLRSTGITDLRHGRVAEGTNDFVPLPDGVGCHAVAAATASRRSRLAERLVGDGLVPLDSALGRHEDPSRRLGFAPDSQFIAWRTGHIGLLGSPDVTRHLLRWLAPPT
jgi:hypothetical protein